MIFGRMLMSLARPFDAEWAHRRTVDALAVLPPTGLPDYDGALATSCAGVGFAHPVCLAAGFDKDARAVHAMARFGFAGAEVGTLTPQPQAGNPRPRLFRLAPDSAVINRMGFNNGGLAAALPRVAAHHARPAHLPVGVNVGANKDAPDRIADYVAGVTMMAPHADWLTINISSPNTPGLRALQDEAALDALLAAVAQARMADGPPVFLKVAPDLDRAQIDGIVRSVSDHGIDAIIIGNTTISRPELSSIHAGESGGLSGAPLARLALARLRDFRSATGGSIALVAAGGIASADDVWVRLRAGASLVQLYSGLVYEGPWLAQHIVRQLRLRLAREGVASIRDIVDADRH